MATGARTWDEEGNEKATGHELFVVVTVADFLAEHLGGNLIPRLELVNPNTGDTVSRYDLEVR